VAVKIAGSRRPGVDALSSPHRQVHDLFRLKLFGGASIDDRGAPLTGRAVQRRRLALLSLLAVARRRGLTRDKAVAYLWPDSNTERARHLLSDSVYRINQALGGEAIVAAGDELRLNPDRLPSDAWEFADALEAGDFEHAVALHSAPFLDGFFLPGAEEFERWCDVERARFARERAHALETLADRAADRDDAAGAARWLRTLAADDPYSSRVALLLMRALERSGDPAEAVRHARVHSLLVREQLGVDPDPEVARFADRLRSGRPGDETTPVSDGPGSTAGSEHGVLAPAPTGPTDMAPTPARRRPKAHWLALAGAVVVVTALAFDASSLLRGGLARPSAAPTAVAVLPFADLSPAGDQEYFADGMTEELTARLSKLDGLAVVGRTSAFAFKGRAIDVREIGKQLGVSVVVEGSVRKSDDRLRIVAQLVDARNGYELWSDTYERELRDVFAVQDEIARTIITRLRGRLAGGTALRTDAGAGDDPDAYNLYLKGRFEWHTRTEAGLRAAADYFRQATGRAPGYARAWAGLGDAYAVLGFYDYLAPADAFPRAAAAANRALELDPSLAEAHATLGYVALYYDWNWERAEAEFLRTIDLDGGYSTGHQWYANLLNALGRFDEAAAEMRAAMELDPLSLIANAALGWVLYHAGEYDRAVDQLGRTLELDAGFELAYLWRGQVLDELGRSGDAQRDLERVVHLSGGSAISRAALARSLVLADDTAAARELLRELEAEPGYVPSFEIAKVHLALGDANAALLWLQRALEQRSHSIAFLAVDPQLRDLHGNAGYQRLVESVGLESVAANRNR
jgi:TolB-like protein/DNA-binding SARP family transcriptional activator/Tfp pilus assembly protein PilF